MVDFLLKPALDNLALSLLRELGPVVTALLFAGRAGSALTAEIGLMKATEQLSSLEMMAVDPLRRVMHHALGGADCDANSCASLYCDWYLGWCACQQIGKVSMKVASGL